MNAGSWWSWNVPYIMVKEQVDQRIRDNREISIDKIASEIITIMESKDLGTNEGAV